MPALFFSSFARISTVNIWNYSIFTQTRNLKKFINFSYEKQNLLGLCRSSHQRPQPATLLKKRLRHRCFPVNFAKFVRTSFLTEHFWKPASVYVLPEKKLICVIVIRDKTFLIMRNTKFFVQYLKIQLDNLFTYLSIYPSIHPFI